MKPDKIEVYDNFFSEDIHLEIFKKLMVARWGISGGTPHKPEIFWHYDGLGEQEYFSDFLYEKICTKLNRKFSKVDRIYANGQTASQCGTPHCDEGDLTFLYYPNPEWKLDYQGHLIFLKDDSEDAEVDRIIEYKPNRAIPVSYTHLTLPTILRV